MKRTKFVLMALPIAALLLGPSSPAMADGTDDVVAKIRTTADCTNKAGGAARVVPGRRLGQGQAPHHEARAVDRPQRLRRA